MKKALLFTLIFMIALSGVFAAPEGFHFGVESHVDYSMVLNDDSAPNEAVFVFNPYISIDEVFLLKLRAEWQPATTGEYAGKNGFDYLFTFDTSDFYTFSSSVLKYIETFKFHTGLFDFGIVRPDENDTLRILTDERDDNNNLIFNTNYKLYAKLDAAIVKAVVESTDFAKYSEEKGYRAAQHAGAEFNIGLVGIVADLYHEGFFKGSLGVGDFKSHRFIARAGMKMQTLLKFFEIGNYITTDIVNTQGAEEYGYSLFDRWMLEVNGKLTAGPFTIDTTLFYNNKMKAYNYLPDGVQCFGVYSDARANFNDFVDLRLYALLPITFDPFEFVRDDSGNSYDKFGAEVKVGKWWYVGGGLEINHLISDLEKKYDFNKMVDSNEVWLKAGIATRNLDVYAKGSILQLDGFKTKLTIGATFRADNFLFYPAE